MNEIAVEQAIYTMRWSKEALDLFVELFNDNDVRAESGERVRIELQDFGRGDVAFYFTTESTEATK